MKEIKIKLYKFNELGKDAQQKAIEKLSTINVDFDWWDSTYMDAENIGLKIKSFDLDRNRGAKGEFIGSAVECANKILVEHGNMCETYKTAKSFLTDLEALNAPFENIEDVNEDEIEELENDFLESLLEDYSIILQNECEYLQSNEAIIETINANEYDFTEDGKLY